MAKAKSKNQIIYGRNPVMEAIDSDQTLERIYLKASVTGEWERELRLKCRTKDIPIKRVPLIKLDKLTHGKNHQGVVALSSLIQYQKLEDVIPFLFEQGKNPVILMLDNVSDVRNIGAIARSVQVLGGDTLILGGKNAGMLNQDAIKTSAGTLSKLTICRTPSTISAIEMLESYGVTTLASTLKQAPSVHEVDLNVPICILLGSEGEGLHRSVIDKCSGNISIPQMGEGDSLNVSVAAGILIYEIQRQRIKTS